MVEGRFADAHELLDADGDRRNAGIILEVGDDVVGHGLFLSGAVVFRGRTIAPPAGNG
jgi:hypothetical protein